MNGRCSELASLRVLQACFFGKKNKVFKQLKKEINLLIAYNIISHIVQHSFHLKTKLELGKFTKTNSVQSRTERHPYSLAGLDEMKKKRMNITLCWVP